MALRLTSTPARLDTPADDELTDLTLSERIRTEALGALGRGDLDGYRLAVAQGSELDDPQRRYLLEVRLIELGLVAASDAHDAAAVRTYVTTAQLALECLEREPSEPIVLNLAAVACYELWALDAAKALFSAAARLDPTLPHLERNRSELARRKRADRPRRPLHPAIPGLARRAVAVARRARPATGLTLSLCMIVRDEERMLGRCLAAARPYVDEIVIVDTGSVDATTEIARSFGATVIEQPWTGSFSGPRNTSFDAATGDWILYLDADEILVEADGARLRELLGQTWREVFRIVETSYVGELGDGTAVVNNPPRIFRNRPGYRFSGTLHEQITNTLPNWAPGRIAPSSVRIDHFGYLGDIRAAKDKARRNLEILQAQLAEVETPTAFQHFNLGCEYGAIGDLTRAARELAHAWDLLEQQGTFELIEYAPRLAANLVRSLRLSGQPAAAIQRAHRALLVFDDATDVVLEEAACELALGNVDRSAELCRRCLELGDAPPEHGGLVGAGTYMPHLALARMALHGRNPAAALDHTRWCLENHPEYPGVTGPYALARMRLSHSPQAIVDDLEAHLNTLPVSARLNLARTLARTGAGPVAEHQYRRVLQESDARRANPTRIALAESLLVRGEFAEAAAVAALVPETDARAAMACRIEATASIALGELGTARTIAARATKVGLSTHEQDVLEAWIEIAASGEPREGMSVACIPLLGTLMEFMLRAGCREQLARLGELLERSRLPRRERLQLLGEMHLRNGSHATAAGAWLAVCAEQPDARARLGLARVAAAQGMYADAAVFAADAVELDGGCTPARELLTLLRAALQEQQQPAATHPGVSERRLAPVAAGVDG